MNHLTLSKAFEGYRIFAEAQRHSSNTIKDYFRTYKNFTTYLGDDTILLKDITSQHVIDFFAAQNYSKKSTFNDHIALSALWTWATSFDMVPIHIMRKIPRSRPEEPDIIPYTETDIRALLASIDRSAPYRGRTHRNTQAHRHRAAIYILLDTGLRVSELCAAKIQDFHATNRKIKVWGKGDKQRSLPISPRTVQIVWKYLNINRDNPPGHAPLIATNKETHIRRWDMLKAIQRIGTRAGVRDVTIHRFRHTFAINYLRNGGNIYALQEMLGHTTLKMVKRYLAIAQTDIDQSHRIASPVSNWGI